MTGPRLTLSGLLGIIAFVALGLGALRSSSVYWVSAVSWLLLLWLCAGLLGVIFRRGQARVFWTGFAVFGWVYLLIVHTAVMSTTLSAEMSSGIHQLIDAVLPFKPNPAAIRANVRYEEHGHAVWIIRIRALVDLLLNFVFAGLGGFLALHFAAKGERDRRDEPTAPAAARDDR